jgi:hypothetical protein
MAMNLPFIVFSRNIMFDRRVYIRVPHPEYLFQGNTLKKPKELTSGRNLGDRFLGD